MERKKRIHWGNLYILITQVGNWDEGIWERFDNLLFKHKAIFAFEERPDIQSAIYIPRSTDLQGNLVDLCSYNPNYTGKLWIDGFDYVSFLNSK